MKNYHSIKYLLLACVLLTKPVMAEYAISLAYGMSDKPKGLKSYQLGMQEMWDKKWFEGDRTYLTGYWDLQVGYLTADSSGNENKSLYQVTFLPSLRFNINLSNNATWYVDAGIGPSLLSKTQLGNRTLSTAFQLYTQLGTGLRFGTQQEFDLGIYYTHTSNAGIKTPNGGLDVLPRIKFAYYF